MCGMGTVGFVYALLLQLYLSTVAFSLWPGMMAGRFLPWLGFLSFTLLVGMALLCHVQTMTTNPGTLPKGYKELNEAKLTLKFTKLFDERNSLHLGPQIRKLMRQGQIA